ncbi:MAG: methyltransferase domain-containing protein [Dokdonella sp.]|uniref:class I SAM-dependent methyltransferase n=1 Tax=Dokdonella sp. TaxID=2291710 RepID=UPI0025C40E29|nr:class I SAM-dependent methyltransferase [Dokdonella sp.]MBX3700102.1 methyltransferase domain-containing protein [Dokdonella sp.]MCW5577549.1 methyltransferase domain-containing protein [Dokdonella sp.]
MSDLSLSDAKLTASAAAAPVALTLRIDVQADVVFDVDVSLDIVASTGTAPPLHWQLAAAGWDVSWLPRGSYEVHALAARLALPEGRYWVDVALWHRVAGEALKAGQVRLELVVGTAAPGAMEFSWQLHSLPGTPPIDRLSWRAGPQGWFFKHFDHAARTTASYLLGDSPLLKGRILDVGCGDGITDLGIALRWRPTELVGIDPFRGYERLPQVLAQTALAGLPMPPGLRFLAASANDIPFADDYFDVVISWGSLEHIVGGYAQALAQIRRVLRPGGLLMVHPGLFYSDIGNHLGEFRFARDEPYVHLKHPHSWLREQVLRGDIERIDRCGDDATPEQYWQWFTELNPITVTAFERELRELGFEPWRVALRTHDRVEYTPQLQGYSFVDLAVGELYVSAWNRK